MISLYDCFRAHYVPNGEVKCMKGHKLPHIIHLEVARGTKLCPRVCQYCPDYDTEGEPIKDNEKGWLKIDNSINL